MAKAPQPTNAETVTIDPETGEVTMEAPQFVRGKVEQVNTHTFLIDVGLAKADAKMEDVSKITLATIGPRGGVSVEKPRRLHGYIMGRATGISRRTNPETDETFDGPAGTFEAVGAEGDIIYKSSVMFLPSAFNDAILQHLRPMLTQEKMVKGETRHIEKLSGESGIQFFVAVYCVYANNKAGYTWTMQPVGNVRVEADPLAEMKLRLLGNTNMMKALPGHRTIEGKQA